MSNKRTSGEMAGHTTIIVGEYAPTDQDIVQEYFSVDTILGGSLDKGKTFVFYADVCGFTKKKIKSIVEVNKVEIKIIVPDKRMISNMRNSKRCSIERGVDNDLDPFKLAQLIVTSRDRDYVYNFLTQNKTQLWFVLKVLINKSPHLTDKNKQIIMVLDMGLFRYSQDMLYHILAYQIQTQDCPPWGPWYFPKTEEKDDE